MEKEQFEHDNYISIEEREHFLSELHRFLVWVGEQVPDEVNIDGETIKLRDIIWLCIHNELSEKEKEKLIELEHMLETKEKFDEEVLQKANITYEEAKKLYHDSAALIRAIMDLKECEEGKVKIKESSKDVKNKIEDAKRWMGFLKDVGKRTW